MNGKNRVDGSTDGEKKRERERGKKEGKKEGKKADSKIEPNILLNRKFIQTLYSLLLAHLTGNVGHLPGA